MEVYDLEKKITVAVEDEKLSLAIGRNGQNARLASKLTGWKVNIMSETEYDDNKRREAEMLVPVGELEGIGGKIRDRLIAADISSVQRLAQAPVETLIKIEGIGQKTAETLIERAKAFVAEVEAKRHSDEADGTVLLKSQTEEEQKLAVSDVFHDDPDVVTEVDEVRQVEKPNLEDVESDDQG